MALHVGEATPDATGNYQQVPALNRLSRLLAVAHGGQIVLSDAARALAAYQPAHSARADLLRRLGRADEAKAAYTRALELTRQEPERRFLEKRLRELPP